MIVDAQYNNTCLQQLCDFWAKIFLRVLAGI